MSCLNFMIILMLMNEAFALDTSDNIDKLVQDYTITKEGVVQQEQDQRKILASLYQTNKKMKKLEQERGELSKEMLVSDRNVKQIIKSIRRLDVDIQESRKVLKEKLLAFYKVGSQGLLRVVFSAKSSSELDSSMRALGKISQRDWTLIQKWIDKSKELNEKKEQFSQKVKKLKAVQDEVKNRESSIQSEQANKSKALAEIKKNRTFKMAKLNEIRSKTSRMKMGEDAAAVLDLFFRPSFFENKGKLLPPMNLPVKLGYGLIKEDEDKVLLNHKGVFYQAPAGTEVRGVFDGFVEWCGFIEGFGNVVILNHGDHYYTVYGLLEKLSVSEGQEVKGQEILGVSGEYKSDFNFINGVYFEIRHFSEPLDPQKWLNRSVQ